MSLTSSIFGTMQSYPSRWMCVVVIAISLLASGCNLRQWANNGFEVGPDYCSPPCADVADNWIDSDDPRVLSQPPEYLNWWSVFQDPVLNELVETSHRQNLTLREAGLRIMQARAQRAMVAGNRYPQTQQLAGGYSREQLGIVAQPLLEPIPGEFKRSFNALSLDGNLSWELDIWGKFRRAIESADADLEASVHDFDAILVCLTAEVVTAYVDIRTFEERLEYAGKNVQIQEQSLSLTQTRANEGKTGDISVYMSQSNLEATKASIPSLKIGLRQANNRLCTLLGMPTVDLTVSLQAGIGIPTAPAEVAIGIPADLLRRRPDVRAAERLVAAQSAQIGIAISDLYPAIAVTGEISVQAEDFNDLFTSLSQGGAVGPGFRWNVLNYGRIKNNVRLQESRFQELIATYQQTVLTANQEVEDGMVAFLQNQERVLSLTKSAQATEQALKLELLNFKEGLTDFSGVFVLQEDLAEKQDQLADARGQIVSSLISVYKALGGGWQAECLDYQPSVDYQPSGIIEFETEEILALPMPQGL